jgi:hypothetical protein
MGGPDAPALGAIVQNEDAGGEGIPMHAATIFVLEAKQFAHL